MLFQSFFTLKHLSDEILKRFLKKEIQQKGLLVRTLWLYWPFTVVFLQHILMMHVNDSLQQLFALTCSYCDPKTLLIFHFLYVFSLTGLSVPLLWSSVFRLLPERKFHYITGVWFQLFGDLVLLVNGFSVWLFGKEVHLNTGLVCEF